MSGRTVLVTGTSSGIGAAIAARLVADGWAVTGLDRAAPVLRDAAFQPVPVDLLDDGALEACLRGLHPVEAFVHAAGFMRVGRLGELEPGAAEAMWRVHVHAASLVANHVAPRLPDGGRIVLIGSRTAGGAPGRGAYAATKAALLGLARSWAMELIERGITVNVIAPGPVDTPMLRDPGRAGVAPRVPPMGRLIKPEEVAALAAFLLSDDAAAITGQQIVVCGGASL